MLEAIRAIRDKTKAINKELIYNYDYSYYDVNVAGSKEGSLVPNENLNEKFGPSRKGYELFKDEYSELGVGYSGTVSVREIYLRDTLDVVGYIMEGKKPTRPYITQADDLYEQALFEFYNALGIEDHENLEALDYYLREHNGYDFMSKDRVNNQLNRINGLIEILVNYEDDEEYKVFIDALKRK